MTEKSRQAQRPSVVQVYRFLIESEQGIESFDVEVQASAKRWASMSGSERIRAATKRLRDYRPFETYRIIHIETALPRD